ncbi:protein FAR1-RELATED SEQUENCE 6-like [Spinacia oleracea]|uniref:Protein FAR1-RELATED SEQUENCE 6-like n=1 Tax=Spinacia oleracea TaxID=3562 RepID=A0ABM3RST6_SPIOL|nr:protein FAR1-RELATED SEQUENCE 6-like [Spinacia oleracea]
MGIKSKYEFILSYFSRNNQEKVIVYEVDKLFQTGRREYRLRCYRTTEIGGGGGVGGDGGEKKACTGARLGAGGLRTVGLRRLPRVLSTLVGRLARVSATALGWECISRPLEISRYWDLDVKAIVASMAGSGCSSVMPIILGGAGLGEGGGSVDGQGLQMASQEPEDLELVEVPKVGMSFPSIEDAFDMVQKYAFSVGFGFVKFSHSTNKAGICVYHKFACHKGGTRKERNYKRERKRPVARTNCPAKVNLAQREGGRWKITQVNVEHNHDMDPRNSRFLNAHRTVPSLLKRRFEMFDATGVKMSKVIRAVTAEAGGPENMPCLPRDCRNYVDKARRERFGGVDAEALYILFTRMQKVSRDFYFEIDATVDGRMKNVFWIDDRSRAAYKEFNDVVTFDTTYLLNKYKMPFAPFVGVNHHGHSILLGCALISNEEAKTFEWLFKTWLQAMGGKAPEAIITDQCPSIGKGISIVFPHARHRWCLWHILVKFPEKCGGFKKYDELRKAFLDVVYENLIVDEFENKWAQMIKDFKLEENNWFQTLYEGREKWVPVFLKDKFWAGMSSSQRSESMNAYFDGYVHSKTPLKSFVEQYEMALGDKIEKEIFADAQCMNADIRCMTTFEMEKQFQKAYTHNLFKKVQDELMAMVYCEADLAIEDSLVFEYKVTERNDIGGGKVIMKDYKVLFDSSTMEVNCICRLFDWKGFLCRHAFKVLFKRNLTLVHERYILRRWRKDVEREHGNIKLLGIGVSLCRKCDRECIKRFIRWYMDKISKRRNSR